MAQSNTDTARRSSWAAVYGHFHPDSDGAMSSQWLDELAGAESTTIGPVPRAADVKEEAEHEHKVACGMESTCSSMAVRPYTTSSLGGYCSGKDREKEKHLPVMLCPL